MHSIKKSCRGWRNAQHLVSNLSFPFNVGCFGSRRTLRCSRKAKSFPPPRPTDVNLPFRCVAVINDMLMTRPESQTDERTSSTREISLSLGTSCAFFDASDSELSEPVVFGPAAAVVDDHAWGCARPAGA
jgi:hypothetical protein